MAQRVTVLSVSQDGGAERELSLIRAERLQCALCSLCPHSSDTDITIGGNRMITPKELVGLLPPTTACT
jgi:hypothetical protein